MSVAYKTAIACILLILVIILGNNQYQIQDVAENIAIASPDQWRYQAVQNDDWKFEVGIQDKPFLPYETIWLEVTATNISDTLLMKPIMNPGEVNLEVQILDKGGNRMYPPNMKTFVDYDFFHWPTMRPGEFQHNYLDLRTYDRVPAEIMHLPPGQYHANIKYKPFPRNLSAGIVKTLDSISCLFEVIPPLGDEVAAYDLFLEFLAEWETGVITIPPVFFQLQEEYPAARNTKFAYEFLLFRSGRFYNLPKMEKHQLAVLRKQYFAKYAGQLWHPDWNKLREVQVIDSAGNWAPK